MIPAATQPVGSTEQALPRTLSGNSAEEYIAKIFDEDKDEPWGDKWRDADVAKAIPLPSHTPFDRDSELRDYYLAAFKRGYTIGITGAMTTCCLIGSEPKVKAIVDGHYAGQIAAIPHIREHRKEIGKTSGKN